MCMRNATRSFSSSNDVVTSCLDFRSKSLRSSEKGVQKMATTLVWDSGWVNFPDNVEQILGQIDVSQLATIRVSATITGATTGVTLFLVHIVGDEVVTPLDAIGLTPLSDISNVYDIPGTLLGISVSGSGASANPLSIRVLIYGA